MRATPLASRSLSILVVDDNEASAQTTVWAVEMFGHTGHLAFKGAEAIAQAKALVPDVIMLDIGLPDMDGYEVCRRLREDPAFSNTVFVAQTGWDQKEHRDRSREAGFHHHLVKPVEMKTLQSFLDTLSTVAA